MVYSLKSSIYEEDRALYNELCTMISKRQKARGEKINMGYMNKSLVMFSFLTLLAISCASSRKKPIIKKKWCYSRYGTDVLWRCTSPDRME